MEVINDNTAEVLAKMKSAKERALIAIGEQAEGYAQALCPVGTPESTGIKGYIGGTLRQSIGHTWDEDNAYIGTNVKYAPYVEYGTSKMAARPYLRPAVENNIEEYKRMLEFYMQNA